MNKGVRGRSFHKPRKDKMYVGPGIYLCYGPLHAQYVWAENFNDAVAKTATADIVPMRVGMNCKGIIYTRFSPEDLEKLVNTSGREYWLHHHGETELYTIEPVKTEYSEKEVISILDEVEEEIGDGHLSKYFNKAKAKYRLL